MEKLGKLRRPRIRHESQEIRVTTHGHSMPSSSSASDVWSKEAPKADSEELLKQAEQIVGIRAEFNAAKRAVELSTTSQVLLRDMPDSVLTGRQNVTASRSCGSCTHVEHGAVVALLRKRWWVLQLAEAEDADVQGESITEEQKLA